MINEVEAIIRRVGAEQVMARFRQLEAGDINEKSGPGDLVTIADRECELGLIPELQAIRNVPVVGEEGVAMNPSLVDAVANPEGAWIVDPVDGTSNFVDGSPDFAVMVAYAEQGASVAAWVWLPVPDVMVVAERGSGAFRTEAGNQQQVLAPTNGDRQRGIVKDKWVGDDERARFAAATQPIERIPDRRCAGVEYLDLVDGGFELLTYWRTHPWDHAPGTLIATEAGLVSRRFDGSDYRVGAPDVGLITGHESGVAAILARLGEESANHD